MNALIPAVGGGDETWPWVFRGGSSWWSDWEYTLRYRVRRQ